MHNELLCKFTQEEIEVSHQGPKPTPVGLAAEPEHSDPAGPPSRRRLGSQHFPWALGQPEAVELGEVPFSILPVFPQLLSTAVVSFIQPEAALGS